MVLLEGPKGEKEQEVIFKELGEDFARFQHNLSLLKRWAAAEPNILLNFGEEVLPRYLRGCKHDVERAKRKIQLNFVVKHQMADFFKDRNPCGNDLKSVQKILTVAPMPKLTPDGCRITIHKLNTADFSDLRLIDALRLKLMIGDIRLNEETMHSGDIYIYDAEHVTASFIPKIQPSLVRRGLGVAQEAYPQRIKMIHIVSPPPVVEALISLIRSFVKDKVRERFVIHHSKKTLLDHIPAEMLPKEYGGTDGDLLTHAEAWKSHLKAYQDWFKEQDRLVAKGPVPKPALHNSCALDDVLGVQGSFRQLAID